MPSILRWSGDLKPSTESPDSFTVNLTAGTEYTFEFSRNFAYPLEDVIPDVKIYNPDGKQLEFLNLGKFTEIFSSAQVIDLHPDVIEVSVYPADNPSMICYTFTPATSGIYTVEIKLYSKTAGTSSSVNSAASQNTAPTLFAYKELRDDDSGAGCYKRFKFADTNGKQSATIKASNIITLRKAYLESSGDISAYTAAMKNVKKNYGIFEAEKNITSPDAPAEGGKKPAGIQVPSTVLGIPYGADFFRGAGFFAITSVKSKNDALKSFTLPVPETKKVEAHYVTTLVSSQQDRENMTKTSVNGGVSLGGFELSVGYSSTSSYKYGLTSTTLVIHYDELEPEYRMLSEDSQYELKDEALNNLAKGSSVFRDEYGDYFVAGYQYGGTYDAFISITTETSEQIESVKQQLRAAYQQVGGQNKVSADLARETEDILKKSNATVTIEVRTAGIDTDASTGVKVSTDVASVGDVFDQLESFRNKLKATTQDKFMPVRVMLKRYRVIPAVLERATKDGYDGTVPIDPEHSTKILNFKRKLMEMQSYFNLINGLGPEKIDSQVLNQHTTDYYKIFNAITAYGNDFYKESNLAAMEEMQTQMESVSDYNFLISEQKRELAAESTQDVTEKPFGKNGGSIGVQTFSTSKAVMSDIAAGLVTVHGLWN